MKFNRMLVLAAAGMAFYGSLQAQTAIEAQQEIKRYITSKFPSSDGRVYAAEFPALSAHMETKYGQANKAGTTETPRLIWVIRVANDPLGNCVKADAFKFNKNDPGLEIKVSTGKCAMYQQEKLVVNG